MIWLTKVNYFCQKTIYHNDIIRFEIQMCNFIARNKPQSIDNITNKKHFGPKRYGLLIYINKFIQRLSIQKVHNYQVVSFKSDRIFLKTLNSIVLRQVNWKLSFHLFNYLVFMSDLILEALLRFFYRKAFL